MPVITTLQNYSDENGNVIEYDGCVKSGVNITFRGKFNKLIVSSGASITDMLVTFDCDNGVLKFGDSSAKVNVRVGQDSSVFIGDGVTTTARCVLSAAEGTTLRIGDDCMISSNDIIRTDDAHPIFDVRTGKRANPCKSVEIGNHVWIGQNVAVLGGAKIGDGSVIGIGSVVKGRIPNNCIAVGSPARVVRKHIAWERPHLTLNKPFFKPDGESVKKSAYWNETVVDEPPVAERGGMLARMRRRLGALIAG